VAEVLKRGRGLPSGTHLSAKMLKEGDTIRSAVVVSKKVAKTAVARNRIRRAVYDAVRIVTNNKHIKPAFQSAPRQNVGANNTAARVIFFVRSIPSQNIRSAFTADVEKILSGLR
jgi:RNase P protein component